MKVTLTYFETGTKEVKSVDGNLFFGDALLSDYIGVSSETNGYTLIPHATIIKIEAKELDEDLYLVDIESVRRSKHMALKRMNNDMDREHRGGAFHG